MFFVVECLDVISYHLSSHMIFDMLVLYVTCTSCSCVPLAEEALDTLSATPQKQLDTLSTTPVKLHQSRSEPVILYKSPRLQE